MQDKKIEQRSGLPKEEVLAQLRARLMKDGQRTLKDEYGSPRRGVETGLDKAFIIDQATCEALIQADPKSAELLKPFVSSNAINRWIIEPQSMWLIHTRPGMVNIDEYPAIMQHLLPFREQLQKRETDQQWFELSQVDHLPQNHVDDLKIVYEGSSDWPEFTLDKTGTYFCNAGFYLPKGDYYLSGLLNSRLFWFLLKGMSSTGQNEVELHPEHLESLPLPMPLVDHLAMIGQFSDFCHRTAAERNALSEHMCKEIAKHLTPSGLVSELSPELTRWYVLDIDSFRAEVKRHLGVDIPQDMVQAWDDLLMNGKEEFNRLNTDIALAERKLDLVVYEMFELTEEEIEYLDKTM